LSPVVEVEEGKEGADEAKQGSLKKDVLSVLHQD